MKHTIVPVRTYFLVLLALLALTATTTWVAYIDLGELNIVVAVTIAVVKALLVILIFMHVKQSSNLTKLFVGVGFFWLLILIALTFSDYASRGWLPSSPWM